MSGFLPGEPPKLQLGTSILPAAGSKLTNFYNSMLLRGAENASDGKAYLYAYPMARKYVANQAKSMATALERNPNGRMARRYQSSLKRYEKQMAYMDETANEFKKAAQTKEGKDGK